MTKNDSPIVQAIKDGVVRFDCRHLHNRIYKMKWIEDQLSWIVYDYNSKEVLIDTKDEARAVAVLLGEKP